MGLVDKDFLLVKATSEYNTLYKVFYDEIVAFEAQRNHVLLHLKGRRIKTYLSISDVEEHLSNYPQFIRLHRAFIISIQCISQIKRGQITMENGLNFMFGDIYGDVYTNLLNTYLLKRKQKEDTNHKNY
ncbi:MAG: LytTR family transcriptional regulator [Flavobacterium sp.]|nr:MAG: LytTR family transcriptional regulator [Flavobacterium sp.]